MSGVAELGGMPMLNLPTLSMNETLSDVKPCVCLFRQVHHHVEADP